MDWFFLIISSVCFVWLFIRLGILGRIEKLKKVPLEVVRIIRASQISDHWKEKVLPCYSLQLFSQSLTIFFVLLVSFAPFFVFSLFSSKLLDGQFVTLASSFKGIAASSITAIFFASFLSSKPCGDYGVSSKILHQMVLGRPFLGEALFDIENLLHGSQSSDISSKRHVFVAGLARAGTTILMRTLYENGDFCSLTYRDMPFILAPNTWRSLSKFSLRKSEKQDRAHGDGIKVDYDSPEALEEVFWRTFCGPAYIKKNCLIPMVADGEVIEKFRSFISLILKSKSDLCYLSKNNNNILRLGSIATAFPQALIVVPFREPSQQAFSLSNQHKRFMDTKDPFTKKYMCWLAHHEFGADHRPFLYDKEKKAMEDAQSLSYWLKLWIRTYAYLLNNLPPQAILLCYETLCDDTEYVWQKLSEKVDLIAYNEAVTFSKSVNQIDELLPHDLVTLATELYSELLSKSIGYRGH